MRRRRVYVAGASADVHLCEGLIIRLRAAGLEVTYDWTHDVIKARQEGLTDATLLPVERARAAERDMDAIVRAHAVWLIAGERPSIGMWVELGMALAMDKTVLISGNHRATIFCELAYQHYDTHEAALAWLVS